MCGDAGIWRQSEVQNRPLEMACVYAQQTRISTDSPPRHAPRKKQVSHAIESNWPTSVKAASKVMNDGPSRESTRRGQDSRQLTICSNHRTIHRVRRQDIDSSIKRGIRWDRRMVGHPLDGRTVKLDRSHYGSHETLLVVRHRYARHLSLYGAISRSTGRPTKEEV